MPHFTGCARMLDGGCDPAYLARRIVRIGRRGHRAIADPRGAADDAGRLGGVRRRLGSPEGELALSRSAVVFLAVRAESNAVYVAFGEAMAGRGETSATLEVPLRLRNAPTRLMKRPRLRPTSYRYAHDEAGCLMPPASTLPAGEMPDHGDTTRPVRAQAGDQASREALARLRATELTSKRLTP